MEVKKIFVILISIFIIFFSSSCFASTTLNDYDAEYVWEYLMGDEYNSYLINPNYFNFLNNTGVNFPKTPNHNWQAFQAYINSINTFNISHDTTYFAVRRDTTNSNYRFYIFNFNNTKPDGEDLPFMRLFFEPRERCL